MKPSFQVVCNFCFKETLTHDPIGCIYINFQNVNQFITFSGTRQQIPKIAKKKKGGRNYQKQIGLLKWLHGAELKEVSQLVARQLTWRQKITYLDRKPKICLTVGGVAKNWKI